MEGHGGEPTAALHIPQHGLVLSDNHNNSTLPPSNTLHYESTTPLPHQGNMYSGRDLGYSLSDCSLPDKRSKRDLVADWLDQQTFVAPEMTESLESLPLAQDGPNTYGHDNDPLQQFLPPQYYQQQQQHQQQQQQSTLPRQLGFPAQLDPNQLYLQQHSINNTGAQREPRQEHRRAIQRSNDLYPGSRTSLYHSHSTKRHSMVALDQQPQHQPNHRLSQPQLQQQQLSSSSSFWRDAPSQPQSQPQSQQQPPTPHQYRPPYPHYPQQHTPHPQQHNLPQYAYYQQQYQQPTSSPSFRPPIYDPYGYDDPDQQDPNHRRSLSLNNSGGRGGVRSRPQSQVYRKAAPARFENLSLAEQARQEHQMRRQHYQQHYHQHRQQQQHQHQHQQYQHQQYYQAPGSRPESMYSNGPAAPRAHTMGSTSPREASQFVPPRHHHQQSHPRPHPPPPQQQQQHHHNSELRHSSVSSPKGSNVSRSANDLAWERHCYYQQQQIQEDALAERKRIEQQLQHQRKAQRPVSSVEGLQVPLLEGSTSLMRTSSMSRISNSSTTAVAGGNASSSLRRRVDSATVAHQSPSSGLSRSVSTSAILEAKQRAANKDKVNSANLKKNKESPVDGTETKSTSVFDDCKFLRLLRRSDSKLDKAATAVGVTMTEANTESPSTSASSKKQSKVPAIATIQPVDSIPSPSPPPPAAATTGLNRRKTLKDLGPSIRSLARRCSSRFSNNSSRPNSFAGSSSDPVIQFSEGKGASGAALGGVRGSHSLSMATSYLPLKMSLSSLPRSLAPGPDGMVDLQQAAEPHVRQSTPSSGIPSSSLTDMPALAPLPSTPEKEQRVPIHRKVTLFRSKTMYLVKSSSSSSSRAKTTTPGTHTADTIDTTPSVSTANAVADDDNNANTKNSARANSFPSRRRPQRDSLRLANGHGLDFNNFLPPITVTTSFSTISAGTSSSSEATEDEQATAVERSTNDLESALPGRSTLVPIPAAIITSSRLSDADLQQKARRQIISLLAMGRKGRISAKTGQSMKSGSSSSSQPSTPTTASSPTTPISQLSPLALEAQEDLFVGGTAGGAKNEGEEDPVERIAFMLVPKSRYEFQPLVVA
ncbi:hypothetical protein BGX24_005419 [Mortierella sp. AD032]|nr:hypothetical protein BGX24_005419 [Mortierella sp. AD032]